MTDKKVIDIQAARSNRNPSKHENKKVKNKSKKKEPLSPRRRKQRNRRIITTVLVIILLIMTIGFSSYKIITLKLEKNRLQIEQEELKKERDELKEEAKNVKSLDYIEQQARKQLHLVLPGEILYVLPESEDKK